MSLKRSIINKAFGGKSNALGMPNIRKKTTTGSPDSNTGGKVGDLLWNTFDGDAYICTAAHATAATWVKINA